MLRLTVSYIDTHQAGSNEEAGEVGLHDLVLLLLDFGVGVVWREDEVDFAAERVDADDPEVAGVHLLLKAVRVLLELLVQLAKDQLQVVREDFLALQVRQLYRQVHPGEVEEPKGVVLLNGLRPVHNLIEQLAQNGHLS